MNGAFATAFALLTSTSAFGVGTWVILKRIGRTHELAELLMLVLVVSLRYFNLRFPNVSPRTRDATRPLSVSDIRRLNQGRYLAVGSAVEMAANLGLLLLICLKFFTISIPDSSTANLAIAILNILCALVTYSIICVCFSRSETVAGLGKTTEPPSVYPFSKDDEELTVSSYQ